MPRALTRTERERFLSELHVGVLAVAEGAAGPLCTPVWYRYEPGGDLMFSTREATRKAALLAIGTRVSFLVQAEGDIPNGALPRYVRIEGPVVKLGRAELDRDLRPLVHRYLGTAIGDAYLAATRGGGVTDDLVVHVRPARWYSRDFAG